MPHIDVALPHGGDVAAARRMFPGAHEPFADLSTGINPHSYPMPHLAAEIFARLPEPDALVGLASAAATAYGVPSPECVVPAPGTQILLPPVMGLAEPGRAAILGPTYSEFARAAGLAGHRVTEVSDIGALADADLAVVANPNNPDGRATGKDALLDLAETLRRRGGLLVVDEAFMDVGPAGGSLGAAGGNVVVLRSFGKFYGLAGLRLGFALAAPEIAARLAAALGPWPVSGAAIAAGTVALADTAWADAMRARLSAEAARLDALLAAVNLRVAGGTSLFRLVESPAAGELYRHLGRAGILVRRFDERPRWLRFGLPKNESEWERLRTALAGWRCR